MEISNDNGAAHLIQSPAHLPMYDNVRRNGTTGSTSNVESSLPAATKSSKPRSSMHVRQVSSSSASTPTVSSTGTSTPPGSRPQSSRKHIQTHATTNNPNKNQSNNLAPNVDKNQFLLEQQIKLTQLHQLQQLQNHIFQQQMALISGQSTSMLPGSTSPEFVGVGIPLDLNGPGAVGGVRPQSHDGEPQSGPHTFSGLPTPAPSGEIRPMDYNTTSPMINLIGSLNMQYIEPLPNSMIPSSNSSVTTLQPQPNIPQPNLNVSQRYGHRHSSSSSLSSSSVHLQNNHQNHASYPSSPSTFNQNLAISPTFHPISPMHIPISHPYHRHSNSHQNSSSHLTPHLSAAHLSQAQMQAHPHSHPSSTTSTPISAPPSVSERIVFNGGNSGGSVHATPLLHPISSVHTSPNVLGSGTASVGRRFGHVPQFQLDLDLDQDISPLTSPWLGATVSSSGGTAVSAAPHASGALIQKAEASHPPVKRTSVSGNKRTASESGDEGDAWSRGGTNRNSRKRPVLGTGGRAGSFTGSVGSNAAATPGLVGNEQEKGEDDGKNRGSTSPASGVSSPVATSTALARDPLVRGGGGGGSGGGHLNGGSSHAPATPLVVSTAGSSSRRTRKGSRSTSTTGTPLLRSTPSTTNLLSPLSPLSPVVAAGGTGLGRREGRGGRFGGGGQGQGQERNSPSPVDLNLEVGQGQDGKSGRSMPPPPLPRGGVDVDMNSTEPTSSVDDSSNHLRHGMLGMGFDGMMSLDEGMSVGMGMGGLAGMGGMEMGVGGMDGMGGMDMSEMGGMGSMDGIGGMTMEEMGVDMGMGVNMGGMGGFGSGHEHSHHLEQRREEMGGMRMDYGRDHDEEGIHISSSMSSTGRTNAGSDGIRPATHQRQRSQSHLQPHSEYQQAQPHLSPAQTPHPRSLSLDSPQVHPLQTEHSHHQLQHQIGQPNPANQQQQPMMPVATPSSILNLGRLGGSGGRLGSTLASTGGNAALSSGGMGVVTRAKKATKASKDVGASSRKRAMTTSMVGSGTGVGVSPSIKSLRPAAAAASESTLPSPALSGSIGPSSSASKAAAPAVSSMGAAGGSTGGGSITATPVLGPADAIGVIRQPKRTHRDAEQRRRNSQKQVIDELRRLLPPIALPSDYNANSNGDSDPASLSPFFFHPTATLLPGGLPPRGPPKTGGEGPNKNVSKLQVLLCGNEYIKLLKARVERRDEEIGKLRREVTRLRALRGGGGLAGDEDVGREEDDLEKDLDAVERLHMVTGKGVGSSAGGSTVQGGSMGPGGGGPDDAMDEDDDDGDD